MTKYKQLLLMVPGKMSRENKIDFYRPLSAQGVYQTMNVVRKMKKNLRKEPEFIFSAAALYMRQTAEIIHQTFMKSELVLRDNLYTANDENLSHFLSHLDDIFESILILAEIQPIQKLTRQLIGREVDLVPSACLCVCWPMDQSWKTIDEATGQVIQLWSP